jgi:hypothetical protein
MASHPEVRRPDMEARQTPVQKRYGDLWPYINIEDQSVNTALLALINARGRSQPATFALAKLNFPFPLEPL